MRSLKVIAKVKEHGNDELLTKEELIVMSDTDNLEEILQMLYGSWYDLIEYTFESIQIHVSRTYIKNEAAAILLNGSERQGFVQVWH